MRKIALAVLATSLVWAGVMAADALSASQHSTFVSTLGVGDGVKIPTLDLECYVASGGIYKDNREPGPTMWCVRSSGGNQPSRTMAVDRFRYAISDESGVNIVYTAPRMP